MDQKTLASFKQWARESIAGLRQSRPPFDSKELDKWEPLLAEAIDELSTGRSKQEAKEVKEWTYSFSAWPQERGHFRRGVFSFFKALPRIEMEFSQKEFEVFRDDLAAGGIVLHEVSRRPFLKEETVL